MRRLLVVAVVFLLAGTARAVERQRLLLDDAWRFTLNDPADVPGSLDIYEPRDLAKARAQDVTGSAPLISYVQPGMDDTAWRQVDLPHDWVVELPFDQRGNNSHGSFAIGPNIGNTIGWYRKKFDLSADDMDKTLSVEFDGVYRNCLVWLNGHLLGRNESGYSSFWFDITNTAIKGTNELVVRVDASRTEGWFYEGAGIYRHVWLVKTAPVHVAHWGTFVSTDVEGERATAIVRTTVRNDSQRPQQCQVFSNIRDADGNIVARTQTQTIIVAPDAERTVPQAINISEAHLWSLDSPYLYTLDSMVQTDTGMTDSGNHTTFGVRTLRFDANQGFFLNGKRVEIQGTCNHQDHAGVGSALPDRLQYFRIEKLKAMGSNALRTSHNDPTPELLDACDKLGMLVMDEHREIGDSPEILGQLRRQVMRDRNHPSVFIWSVGNEEPLQSSALGASVCVEMEDVVHQLDPTRLCTQAMNNSWGTGVSTVIDVQGFNYLRQGGGGRRGATVPATVDGYNAMDRFHAAFPNKPAIGTEEASTLSTRGQYADNRQLSYEQAYDLDNPGWGTTAEQWWPYYLKRPWCAGAFVWTGFDYRGEPTPYRWPAVSSQFGIMDTCGFPKDIYYYYQANWTSKPVVHLLPHWNWAGKEGQPIDVWCFSNADSVELFLNGTSLGRQNVNVLSHLDWKVPYAAGTLEARGYDQNGAVVKTDKVETTGAPAKITLTPDRATIDADNRDVSVVTVAVTDDQGRTVPTAENLVKFSITGGKLIGVGNGNPGSHEPDKAKQRKAFAGLCMALVQSTHDAGPITLTAGGDGLAATTVTINAGAPQPAATQP